MCSAFYSLGQGGDFFRCLLDSLETSSLKTIILNLNTIFHPLLLYLMEFFFQQTQGPPGDRKLTWPNLTHSPLILPLASSSTINLISLLKTDFGTEGLIWRLGK